MPGHYLQLAHANQYPSTLREVLSSGPFIEGWAVYTERVMIEQGYMNGDPLMKLIQLKWYLRTHRQRAARPGRARRRHLARRGDEAA